MFARRTAAALQAAVALVIITGSVALADTTGDNADRWSASASWSDGGAGGESITGVIDRDLGTFVEYNFYHEVAVTCEDGSSSTGSISFFGQSPASVSIDKKLASASGSGTVAGSTDTYDPCTGETTSAEASYQVAFALHATSGTSTSVTKTKQTTPDGRKVIVTTSISDRDAGGSVTINSNAPISPDSGQLQHLVVVTK